jgi:ATP-dependent Clp protease ATP-binding subunit ClpC
MMMTLDPAILAQAQAARERMLERQHELDRARTDLHHEIRRLHASGGSMREISEELGVSHQRVHQIVTDGEAGPDPLLKRLGARLQRSLGATFAHFSEEARAVVVRSQEEARALGAKSVEAEHLLLAVAAAGEDPAARALAQAGAGYDALRAAVQRSSGPAARDAAKSKSHLPFAPASKKALELSLREALRLGDSKIASRHVLLGLLRGSDPRLLALLADLGASPEVIRAAVEAG